MNRREILFRGKRVDNGEWIYGSLVTGAFVKSATGQDIPYIFNTDECDTADCFEDFTDDYGYYEVDPSTVGQLHNALTRKAGTNVFVGDIIRHDLEEGLGQPKRIGEISTVNSIEFDYAYYINVRVVGTIHDTQLTQQS